MQRHRLRVRVRPQGRGRRIYDLTVLWRVGETVLHNIDKKTLAGFMYEKHSARAKDDEAAAILQPGPAALSSSWRRALCILKCYCARRLTRQISVESRSEGENEELAKTRAGLIRRCFLNSAGRADIKAPREIRSSECRDARRKAPSERAGCSETRRKMEMTQEGLIVRLGGPITGPEITGPVGPPAARFIEQHRPCSSIGRFCFRLRPDAFQERSPSHYAASCVFRGSLRVTCREKSRYDCKRRHLPNVDFDRRDAHSLCLNTRGVKTFSISQSRVVFILAVSAIELSS